MEARERRDEPLRPAQRQPVVGRRAVLNLTKWYLDLVTPGGTALIAYAAELRWRALRVEFASTFLAPAGADPVEASAWSSVRLPAFDGDALRFAHEGLGIDGTWRRTAPSVTATLFEDDAGRVQWDCLQPAARASVRIGDTAVEGFGYVERLTFTRPPWSLPLNSLRWGRYVSDRHALVWIRWAGGPPAQWIWLDGADQPRAVVGDDGVVALEEGVELGLDPGRVLLDRKALQVLVRQLPALDALPMGPLKRLRETKRLDRGRLEGPSLDADEGWVIHETVTW